MSRPGRFHGAAIALVVLAVGACGGGSSAPPEIPAATLERFDGTDQGLLILTADAARRLDITTTGVRSEKSTRTRSFGADVLRRLVSSSLDQEMWVRVTLTEDELQSVDLGQPGLVPLALDGEEAIALTLEASVGASAVGESDVRRQTLFYAGDGTSRLILGSSVLIELQVADTQRLIVPYSSVIYDPQARTWVYTNPAPLVFTRHPVVIAYIDGDQAFLSAGPPSGTQVVSAGAAELWGFESGIGN